MLTAKELKGLIVQHVIDVHMGDNWAELNLADTLENATVEEAISRTPACVNTIAALWCTTSRTETG